MSPSRIVCAACLFSEGLVLGARHWDTRMHDAAKALFGSERYAKQEDVQGFIDQFGNFLDRQEAWVVAEREGQIRNPNVAGGAKGTLYSEHLY